MSGSFHVDIAECPLQCSPTGAARPQLCEGQVSGALGNGPWGMGLGEWALGNGPWGMSRGTSLKFQTQCRLTCTNLLPLASDTDDC
jgi:hypothetical protein